MLHSFDPHGFTSFASQSTVVGGFEKKFGSVAAVDQLSFEVDEGTYLRKSLLELHLGQDVSWLDLQYDTFLSGRSPWVSVLADILLGKLVNVRVGTFECL